MIVYAAWKGLAIVICDRMNGLVIGAREYSRGQCDIPVMRYKATMTALPHKAPYRPMQRSSFTVQMSALLNLLAREQMRRNANMPWPKHHGFIQYSEATALSHYLTQRPA